MFFRKNQNVYSSNLNAYIEKLQKGDWGYIPLIFCVFAENSPAHKLKASQILSEILRHLSLDDICRIDRRMRDTTSMEWYINWGALNIKDFITKQMAEEEKRAVLIFSSFNPNGYIRQQAVELLVSYNQTLPYIFLRANDWVPNVRQTVLTAFSEKIKTATDDEIVNLFPFVEKLRKSQRCNYTAIMVILKDRINNNKELLAKGLMGRDIRAKRLCFSFLAEYPLINYTFLLNHVKKEKDPLLRKEIFQLLRGSNIYILELSEQFLKDKHSANRLMALQYLRDYDPCLVLGKIEHMIWDKSLQVRTLARDIILNLNGGIDFHQLYLETLSINTAICIYGLVEVGSLKDCHIIERYLNDDRIAVIRAAMISLMHLNSKEFVVRITDMLSSEYVSIVKTAKLLLEKYRDYDFERVFEIQKNTTYENTKIKCASLLFLAPKWKSLIYTLMLMGSNYQQLEILCQLQINKWNFNYNCSYQLATKEEKQRIKELITAKKSSLTPQIEKQLAFVLR